MVTIAAMTGIRRSDVPRSIRRIERLGLLQTARHGPRGTNLYTVVFHPSASLRTVRTAADGGCPQECEPGVRTDAAKVSAIPRTKQPDEQTPARRAAPERVHVIDSASEFELFWRVYPSRHPHSNPKKPARQTFEAAVGRGIDPALIIRGAENFRSSIERTGTDARYVTQAVTWLRQERWNDDQQAPEPPRLRSGMI